MVEVTPTGLLDEQGNVAAVVLRKIVGYRLRLAERWMTQLRDEMPRCLRNRGEVERVCGDPKLKERSERCEPLSASPR